MLMRRARAYSSSCSQVSISSHFGAIYSWNACHSPKSRKIH